MQNRKIPKWLYYLLSFTWGLPMTLIGCFASLGLLIARFKPKKNCYGWYFECGHGWGGVNLGPCSIVSKDVFAHTLMHEFGHSIQNCYFGPFTIFIVCIPSVMRYWLRKQQSTDDKQCYCTGLFGIVSILIIALFLSAYIAGSFWLLCLSALAVIYEYYIFVWLLTEELPLYFISPHPKYDDIWFEGDASKIGYFYNDK